MNKQRKFWFKCTKVESKEITKISIIAKDLDEAEERLKKNKDTIIPLEYLGWEEINNG